MTAERTGGAAPIGWQTLLADLSLILFMVTAAAMSAGPDRRPGPPPASSRPSSDQTASEPLALWRAGGAQTLPRWLAGEQPDRRQQLTITARYRPGTEAGTLTAVQALVFQAGAMGKAARVIIVPVAAAADVQTVASLAYDRLPDSEPARLLLDGPHVPPPGPRHARIAPPA